MLPETLNMRARSSLFLVVGLFSCGETLTDDTSTTTEYCYSLDDKNTHFIDTGGGDGASGKLYGRLVTDKAEDLHDPNFVANVEYTLQSLDVGGSQQTGETTSEGDFVETLGAGSWLIKVADQRQGYSCQNDYEFTIEAGDTTRMCLDLACK